MIHFKDFVPTMISAPSLFKSGEHENFEEAVAAANQWIKEFDIEEIAERLSGRVAELYFRNLRTD